MARLAETYRGNVRNRAREIRKLTNRMRDPSKTGRMPWWAALQQAKQEVSR